jgi:putative aldouronate transport system substrate-binding protein
MFKMKKLSKKVLALSLVATMLFATTGCGSDDDAKKTDTDPKATPTAAASTDPEATPTEAAAPAEKTTIRIFRDTFNVDPSDAAQVQKVADAVNAYIADKGNVQVEITEIGNSEYKEKANLALVNGEIDLMFTANWLETVGCDDLVKQNAAYDITTLLPNYGVYTVLPEWIWKASSYDGKNYFIPNLKEVTEGYNLMFRSDLVAKYGWDLSTVKSIKDIEPMLVDCKAEGLQYPYLTQHHPLFFRYYIDRFDFFAQDSFMAVDKTTDAVVNTVQTPEYLEFATIMGDFLEKGYINENDLTKTTPETTTQTQDWGISWWTDIPNNDEAISRYAQDGEMVLITQNWVGSNTTIGSA